MEIQKIIATRQQGIKFSAQENGQEVGRTYLYILYNDLHAEPFGFLEDLFVEEQYRSQGIGRVLIESALAVAKEQKCYKVICTSRHGREELHAWYKKLGFKEQGVEFRMDF
jgi:GNAT superfamily N-acetyltransferase